MRLRNWILILVIGIFSSTVAWCNTDFDKGLALSNNKQYEEAIIAFQKVLEQDPYNASTYYNIGHCYFELKLYGDAIWAFEKTVQYDPKNSNALKNLEVCHYKLDLPLYEPINTSMWRSFYAFGSTNWSILAIICSFGIAIAIFLMKRKKGDNLKRILVILILGLVIVEVFFIYLASASSNAFDFQEGGVVTQKSIPTYLNAAGELSPIRITEGTRIKSYSAIKGGKYTVVLANDQEVIIDHQGWRKFE